MSRRSKRMTRGLILMACTIAVALLGWQLNRTQLWEDQKIYAGWRAQAHVWTGHCRLLDDTDRVRRRGWAGDCLAILDQIKLAKALEPRSRHLVLLLHGLGRSPWIFKPMEQALRAAGYEAVAIAYPSLTKDVGGHAAHLEHLLNGLEDVERVSFVTHSLGALVLRETLVRHHAAWRDHLELGRAIMLAPPNQGAALARSLEGFGPFHVFGGPSAGQLAKGAVFADPPASLEFGIIAGGTAGGHGYNPLLPGNDDGVVRIAETDLPGASDKLVVPGIHTVIAGAPETIAAVLAFLSTGRFS